MSLDPEKAVSKPELRVCGSKVTRLSCCRMGSWFSSPAREEQETQENSGEGAAPVMRQVDYVPEVEPLPTPLPVHQDVCQDVHHQDHHEGVWSHCHDTHHMTCHNDHHHPCSDAGHYSAGYF